MLNNMIYKTGKILFQPGLCLRLIVIAIMLQHVTIPYL